MKQFVGYFFAWVMYEKHLAFMTQASNCSVMETINRRKVSSFQIHFLTLLDRLALLFLVLSVTIFPRV